MPGNRMAELDRRKMYLIGLLHRAQEWAVSTESKRHTSYERWPCSDVKPMSLNIVSVCTVASGLSSINTALIT